jgi:putative oxidoreductase
MGMIFGTTARNRWLGPLQSWALLPLRLVVGYGFAAHGYAKLVRGPAAFAEILAAIGVPAPVPAAWVTSLLEFVGGISLMLGAAVVPLGLPLIVVMATAMFGVHARYGFSSVRLKSVSAAGAVFGPVGFELNLVYIAALLALGLGGPSPLSVDRWIESRRTVRQETPHGDARHRS